MLNNLVLVGRVVETLPNIEVHTHTMPLYKDDLLIDKWLLSKLNKLIPYLPILITSSKA